MTKEDFDIRGFTEISTTLKTIADQYPHSSREYRSIEIALKALLFACETATRARFEKFLGESGQHFSPKQREHLKRMGLPAEDD